MRAAGLALAALLIACPESPAPSEPEKPATSGESKQVAGLRRGLWVLAEGTNRTLESPAKISALVEHAVAWGATDLFVQVYRGGRSWFPSTHADPAPYDAMHDGNGPAPLGRLIDAAHARGLKVHAWFNTLRVAKNRAAPLLAAVGREAVLSDRKGRSLLDYPDFDVPPPDRSHTRLGTPGLWLDPAVPGVVDHLDATLADLLAATPHLDGLHLDFIRHPVALPMSPGSRFDVGLDFGYSTAAKARFVRDHGRFRRGDAWDRERRDAVTAVVARFRERVGPDLELSAAVLPWADRAYLSSMQDWRGWLESGALDFAVAMAYSRDDTLLRYVSHGLVGGIGGDRVWLGLGTWLFVDDAERVARQIEIALEPEPAGVALFSYDALVAAPNAVAGLVWNTK